MAKPTIAAGYPKVFLDFAVSKGADRRALIERSGICADEIDEPDNRVPLANYLALLKAGIELTNEPALALQFGEDVRMQEISIVGLICEACETTAEVGPQLNRYARLVVDEDSGRPPDLIRAVKDEDGLWLELPSDTFTGNLNIAEAEIARLVCNVRAMFGSHPFFQNLPFPRAVRFTISFSSDRNALLTDEAPQAAADEPLCLRRAQRAGGGAAQESGRIEDHARAGGEFAYSYPAHGRVGHRSHRKKNGAQPADALSQTEGGGRDLRRSAGRVASHDGAALSERQESVRERDGLPRGIFKSERVLASLQTLDAQQPKRGAAAK